MKEFTVLMALLMSIVAISIDAMLPALGFVAADLHVANPNHTQFVISFLFMGMTLGQLVCGPLSDALGRRTVLFGGLALYLAGSVLCFLAPTFHLLLLGRLIQGLGVAGPYVSTVSIVRDRYAGRDMARVMSLVMMIFMLVPALAPSIGQVILRVADWRAIFLLYIGYAIIVGIWIRIRLPETLSRENRIPFKGVNLIHGFKEIVRNRLTISYTLCMGICFGSLIGYLNSSQQIFQVQFGVGEDFALYFGGLALVLGVASLCNSRMVQRLGMRHICLRAILNVVISSALFLALHLFVEIELWMFMTYAVLLFFSFGLMFGNLNSMAMEPMGHIAGIASAVIGSMSSAISMTVGSFIGQLYNNTLIPMAAGFLLLGTLSFVIMRYAARQPLEMAK